MASVGGNMRRVPAAMACGDLREWHRLRARCPRCGHMGDFTPAQLRRAAKMAGHLQLVERKLRCRRCDSRDCVLLIETMERNV